MTGARPTFVAQYAKALALGLALASSSCFPQALSPERANADWVRLETEHFDLATDLAPEQAKRAAGALERARAALLAVGWQRPTDAARITARTPVVVLRDASDFERYSDRRFYGQGRRPTVFLHSASEEWDKRTGATDGGKVSVLLHELTHQIAAGFYVRQPRWFSEGLAQFLETMRISEDGTIAELGGVNLTAFESYMTQASSVSDVLAWRGDHDQDDRITRARYGVSWLLVHFLFNTKPGAFAELQTKLAAGVDPGRAWSEIFPNTTPAELDDQLDQYWRHGRIQKLTRSIPRVPVASVNKPISAADVLAIRALLAINSAEIHASDKLAGEAQRETYRALTLEPGHALALRLMMKYEGVPRASIVERLHAQVARRPDDGEAWLLLSQTLDEGTAEGEAAARRAVVLMPRSAEAYNSLAWTLVLAKRGEAALPFASKAVLLAPWSGPILDTYAAALSAVGRCLDALIAQRRAVEVSAEALTRAETAGIALRLAEYMNACGETKP